MAVSSALRIQAARSTLPPRAFKRSTATATSRRAAVVAWSSRLSPQLRRRLGRRERHRDLSALRGFTDARKSAESSASDGKKTSM